MIKFNLTLLLLSVTVIAAGQTAVPVKEQKFISTVKAVVTAFSKQDSAAVSKYIKPGTGLYQLYRNGVFDNYEHQDTIRFTDPGFPNVQYMSSAGIKYAALQYAKLPTYNCETMKWSKRGVYADTTKTSHILSKICKDRNQYVPDNIPQSDINKYYSLENKSRRIVVFDRNQKELVFYLSWINNRWYLTIVDFVTSDCSA